MRTDRNSRSAMALLDSPCAAERGDVALAGGERHDHDERRSGPASGHPRRPPASAAARTPSAAAARPSPCRWNACAASVADSAASSRAPSRSKRSVTSTSASGTARGRRRRMARVGGDEVAFAQRRQLGETIGDGCRVAETGDIVEEPRLCDPISARRRQLRCRAQHVPGPGQITRRDQRPCSAQLLLGRVEQERRAPIQLEHGGRRSRGVAQAGVSGGEGGQHEPARSDDVVRVTSGQGFTEPAPGRLDPSRQQRAPAQLVAEPHRGRQAAPSTVSPRRRRWPAPRRRSSARIR